MQSLSDALYKRYMRSRYMVARLATAIGMAPERRRVIFLHLPKCAGSSVNFYFKARLNSPFGQKVVLLNDARRGADWEDAIAAARTAPFVGGHFGAETLEKIRGDAFVFTFLRDPVARLKSMYSYLASHHRDSVRLEKSFEQFVLSKDPDDLLWSDNVQARQLAVSFAYPGAATLHRSNWAEAAIRNLAGFNFVGRTETFDSDFMALVKRIGMDVPKAAPVRNTTQGEQRRSGLNQATLELSPAGEAALDCLVASDRQVYSATSSRWS
jgi:hypothetical protein